LFVESWFKSYYVVWKHDSMLGRLSEGEMFKSYYVVWKLYFFINFVFRQTSFKSYYVVWKPVAYFVAGLCFAQV